MVSLRTHESTRDSRRGALYRHRDETSDLSCRIISFFTSVLLVLSHFLVDHRISSSRDPGTLRSGPRSTGSILAKTESEIIWDRPRVSPVTRPGF